MKAIAIKNEERQGKAPANAEHPFLWTIMAAYEHSWITSAALSERDLPI